jgi:hypothetical protein
LHPANVTSPASNKLVNHPVVVVEGKLRLLEISVGNAGFMAVSLSGARYPRMELGGKTRFFHAIG